MKGVANLVSWGVPVENAVEMGATNPARILGLGKRGLLVPGYEADLIIFGPAFGVVASMVAGNFVMNGL
jgi:N-acetylglucosamine-6-phosphate deacetylase